MAQQTAVDYLIKQISEILGPLKTEGMTDLLLIDAVQKAKQMEKQQIVEAWQDDKLYFLIGEHYYEETYGK